MARNLERHLHWIRAVAHRKLGRFLRSKTETGDIVQDALVQFLRYGPRIHLEDEAQLRALLARIVENVIRDKYDWFTARRRAIARERPLPADTVLHLSSDNKEVETPSQVVSGNERGAWIRLGLELLAPEDRRVLVMRDWDRLSFIGIGKCLGVSHHAARRKYIRSLNLLTEKVGILRSGRIGEALQDDRKDSNR